MYSLEVQCCKTSFNEAKIYFDKKNHIHALKIEAGIMAATPHYGLFFQSKAVRSFHDYEYYKVSKEADIFD